MKKLLQHLNDTCVKRALKYFTIFTIKTTIEKRRDNLNNQNHYQPTNPDREYNRKSKKLKVIREKDGESCKLRGKGKQQAVVLQTACAFKYTKLSSICCCLGVQADQTIVLSLKITSVERKQFILIKFINLLLKTKFVINCEKRFLL